MSSRVSGAVPAGCLCGEGVWMHTCLHTPLCFATVGVSCVHASVFTCVHRCTHLSVCCGVGGLISFALSSHRPGHRASPRSTTCGGCTWEPTPRRSARPVRGEPPTEDPLSVPWQTLCPLCHQLPPGVRFLSVNFTFPTCGAAQRAHRQFL